MSRKNGGVNPGLTKREYWDSRYKNVSAGKLSPTIGYKRLWEKLIMDKIIEFYSGGAVLEVGAGNSDWIIKVINELKPDYCAGLDYSTDGCRLLEEKAKKNGVRLDVVHADMFFPPENMGKKFDFIMSFGVVEHFEELGEVLRSITKFSKPGGLIFSLIPNMAGINGKLTRLWNKDVYDMHVAHDLRSFVDGHHYSNLEVLWAGYLGSTNFSVLASCFDERKGLNFFIYKQLTRLSKALWFFESKVKELPVTRAFSPYILVVGKVPE